MKFMFIPSKYFSSMLAILVVCITIVSSGCSSTTPILRTYTEYLPPIKSKQLECIEKFSEEKSRCQESANKQSKICMAKARELAEEVHTITLINFEKKKENQKKKLREEERVQYLKKQQQSEKYEECKRIQAKQKAALNAGASLQGMFDPLCEPPMLSYNQPMSDLALNLTLDSQKPRLHINDRHCFKDNDVCQSSYDTYYEKCGGKIIRTTRCFANCEGEEN